MARFHGQTADTPEKCLSALDELVAMGPHEIDNWEIGCAVGDHSNHISYRTVEAADGNAARRMVPESLRSTAQIAEVGKLTAEQVRALHQ